MDIDLDGNSGDFILFRNFDAWISSLSRGGRRKGLGEKNKTDGINGRKR